MASQMNAFQVVERIAEIGFTMMEKPVRNIIMRTPHGDFPVAGISGDPETIILHSEITDELPEGYG